MLLAIACCGDSVSHDVPSFHVHAFEQNTYRQQFNGTLIRQVILWDVYDGTPDLHVVRWFGWDDRSPPFYNGKRWVLYRGNIRVTADHCFSRQTEYDPEASDRQVWPIWKRKRVW